MASGGRPAGRFVGVAFGVGAVLADRHNECLADVDGAVLLLVWS